MRILLIHKTKRGGVAVHVRYLKEYLEKKGHEVAEITRNEDLKLTSFAKSYSKLKELYRKWSSEYDVIHAHDWSIAYPGVKSGIKNLIATFHGLPTSPIAKYFEDYSVKELGRRAVVISPYMLKYYPEAQYIPPAVDPDVFRRMEGFVVENRVGIAQSYNSSKIIKIAKKVGFKIEIVRNIPNRDMPKFYSRNRIFISVPPRTTGVNMVWLEAMSCGVPYIIGTNHGIGEILPIYKINNFKELEILLRKIKAEELLPLKGSREWVIQNGFTWENHVNKLIQVYKRILESI